jgi:UDP-N-acetylmuramate--alanine ligase
MCKRQLKVYISGIAGSGVSAIAGFMADRGNIIAGSDRAFDSAPANPLKKVLQAKGITIVPQDGNTLDTSFDLAVFSTAVEPERPDYKKAISLGIPVRTRPEYLAGITKDLRTIAVSGTSGKSTASGMLAFLMQRLGLEPNFIGGGRVRQFKSYTSPGNSLTGNSDILIIEACESDGSIVNFHPQHSIILNLSLDHHTIDKTSHMFKSLIKNTSEKVFLNADDSNLNGISPGNAVTFSIDRSSDYRAEDITFKPLSSDFSVRGMRFRLSLPGTFNIYNALSCIALLSETGVSSQAIADVLPEFEGLDRRFDIHLNDAHGLVVDDYAHNPRKISSLMETVKRLKKDLCFIFQPHGYGPTRLMKEGYIKAFARNLRESDSLMILPIFYVGGTVARDISSHDLVHGIKEKGGHAEAVEKREDILKRIQEFRSYVIFGARDETLSDLAREIAGRLTQKK